MNNITHYLPKIVNLSPEDMDTLVRRLADGQLTADDKELILGCIEFATWLPETIREKNISIRNLQRMLFGETGGKKKKKKNKNKPPQENASPAVAAANDIAANEDSPEPGQNAGPSPTEQETQNTRKGHGRLGQSAYATAEDVFVSLETYVVGDKCPCRCGGRLYDIKKPGVIIRITGNAMATVHRYHLQKLRCALCGNVETAPLPPNAPAKKYDATFKAQLAIQKYYVAVPFYRQEQLQRLLGFPLPDATQFELVEQVADAGYPVVKILEKKAANGQIVHNDDTRVKILSVIQQNKAQPDKERTGMQTTGLIIKAAGHTIALYYSGVKHAGENLQEILRRRATDQKPIIQMCDASSMNMPNALETILCNCLGHGFRKFRDLLDFFPEPCLKVMKALSAVFKFDEQTQAMTPLERWLYHRQNSKPVMLELNRWLKSQLAEKQVEPNSSLGKAMRYLLKNWKKLRRFLVIPGAPIDNNIVERALKIPIRVRKNAMFYKTEHGAVIGSLLTSLIQTAALAHENPLNYLVALQDHKSWVFKNPEDWLPWNYRQTLEAMSLRKAA